MRAFAILTLAAINVFAQQNEQYEGSAGLQDVMFELDAIAQESGVACPADVLFVLDATGSMKDVFEDSLNYITKVLQGLTISPNADRVGVIVYSSSTKQKEKIPLGSINDPAQLTKAVQALPFLSGTTATGAALGFAEQALRNRRADVHTTVVVITDGFSYDSTERTATQLRNHPNTVVLAVTMGHVFLRRELEKITGSAETVLSGPTSYGQLVKLIKTCENDNAKQENQDENEGSASLRSYATTDNLGRYLVSIPPVPEYSGDEASGESSYGKHCSTHKHT
ncbi:hypothetical protein Y032_0029g1878 [Ancylostoma ceylanicum]|uniref:VWFA domain-containing protein n=1 Tax=Ancylostoma ceylanicum TaxID=53326 RepID=A0A016USK1_9BILA|nr:hypothetical protein Y032_0029g1878 [Ancylostoma ceylanicum]